MARSEDMLFKERKLSDYHGWIGWMDGFDGWIYVRELAKEAVPWLAGDQRFGSNALRPTYLHPDENITKKVILSRILNASFVSFIVNAIILCKGKTIAMMI